MSELEARIASLSPEKRRLLERRLARAGLERRSREGGGRTIPRRAEGPGPWPLTHGQRRLWFIDRMNPGTPAYNIPFAGRLAGPLDAGLLERSLREVVRRHAVLRSRFVLQDGEPVQVVDPDPGVRLPVVDLSRLARGRRDAEARRLTDAEPQAPFDLARGPVARMTVVRHHPPHPRSLSHPQGGRGTPPPVPAHGGAPEEGLHDLLVTMPHLVTDAWSMAVLFRELPALYDAFRRGRPSPLPDPPVQVADYALWERERQDPADEDGELARGLAFWREHLRGAPRALE
ncbi:MAG TPA: condensation domain-containing protein, partial [Thermoanaerobaculia bacterium]|nr:condensation domain-containing protein [Thermoanaerobaculia bacterium]